MDWHLVEFAPAGMGAGVDMARGYAKLTKRQIEDAPPGRYSDGGGLYLIVDAHGRRWIFRFRRANREREMGLGPLRDVSLAKARAAAAICREHLRAGQDPIEAKRRGELGGQTFGAVADAYVAKMKPQFKNSKHHAQWQATLSDAYIASLRKRPVADIGVADVLAVLKPIWTTTPETADRIRGRIERVLDAARAQNLRQGENPARWRGHLDHLLPRRQALARGHHKAMPYADMPAFIGRLHVSQSITARCLEFTILTAARTGEVIGAEWGEFAEKIWTVPAARMKSKRPHRVPLPARCLAIIEELRPLGGRFVFPGIKRGRHLSNMAMLRYLQVELEQPCTVHGFRSSFKDWSEDKTSFQRETIEAALAHVIGDKTEAAYRRSDAIEKRRRLMEAWAGYCLGGSNVVALVRR